MRSRRRSSGTTCSPAARTQWEYAVDLANWSLLRRTDSRRQLLEVMTDFWRNHLHVPSIHDLAWSWRNHYDAMSASGALGTFDDLLLAASLHPAMLLFLSNYESTKDAPNENQGRELLELHTVGRDAGYTEAMVKDSARILTGYTVNAWENWEPRYDRSIHWTGECKVLGFSRRERARRRPSRDAWLSRATSRITRRRRERIATKLAMRFVSDQPVARAGQHAGDAFTKLGHEHPGDIARTRRPSGVRRLGRRARCAIRSRTSWPQCACSASRRSGREAVEAGRSPRRRSGCARASTRSCGRVPTACRSTNDAWSSASQVLGSLDLHYSLAGGWVGDKGSVALPRIESWLPQQQMRFDAFVDHLCRACCSAASRRPAS